MTELTFDHSSEEWIAMLLCYDDISTSERNAVWNHVQVCAACNDIYQDRLHLGWLMDNLPAPEIPPGLPPKLLQLWEEEERNHEEDSFILVFPELRDPDPVTERQPESQSNHHREPVDFEQLIRELME